MSTTTNVICVECGKPIGNEDVHYWGRLGGEWHPACYALLERRGECVVGLWANTTKPFTDPPEYHLELRGFIDGAGI